MFKTIIGSIVAMTVAAAVAFVSAGAAAGRVMERMNQAERRIAANGTRIGDPSPASRSGIYAEIDRVVAELRLESDERIGDPETPSGVYADLYRLGVVPIGAILPWVYTPQQPDVPDGWILCDGTNGTPNLSGLFLRGVTSRNESKQTGGRADIPDDGEHNHGGLTGSVHSNRITYDRGGDNNGVWFEHAHAIPGEESHDHGGTNLPPYYTVMYIMKVD